MSVSSINVLICDDSIVSRKQLKNYILSLGCKNVLEAVNGEEAVTAYEKYKPDLVFMDIVMPKKDGIESLREIISSYPNAKIVMASSVGTQSSLKDAISAGAIDFLQKPLDFEKVKKLIVSVSEGGK